MGMDLDAGRTYRYGTGEDAERFRFQGEAPTRAELQRFVQQHRETGQDSFSYDGGRLSFQDETQRPRGLFGGLFRNTQNAGVNARSGPRLTTHRAGGTGTVRMALNGVRDDPIQPALQRQLERMANDLGLDITVYSGGQPATGPNRTGTSRHDHGYSADIYAERNGQRLSGAELAPLVDWWYDNNVGGVGFGMDHFGGDTGLHLDLHQSGFRFWAYGTTRVPSAILQAVPPEHRRHYTAR